MPRRRAVTDRRYGTTLHAVAFGILFDSAQARRAVEHEFDGRLRRCARALLTTRPAPQAGATERASL